VLEFLLLAIVFFLAFITSRYRWKSFSGENKGCVIPLLLIALGAMFLRRELLYFRADKPSVSVFPFIMGGVFIIILFIYLILTRDERLEKIKTKIKKYFKR